MAGDRAQPYISVLERNMENPEYKKQLEQQQALQGSYPELAIAPLAKSAVNVTKNFLKGPTNSAPTNIKIGSEITDPNDPVWKYVDKGPSPMELLKKLREEELLYAKQRMDKAFQDSLLNSNRRFYAELPNVDNKDYNSRNK